MKKYKNYSKVVCRNEKSNYKANCVYIIEGICLYFED